MDFSAVDTTTARLPSRYQAAKAALRDCTAVDECKEWADKASALASYAKQAGDTQLEDMAKRIRARAMRRAGELLKQIEPGQGARDGKRADGSDTPLTRETAARAAGFSERQQFTATRIASIPEGDFEEMVERGATVTEMAAAGTQRQEREPNREEAKRLMATVKAYADRLSEIDINEALTALSNTQRAELRMLIARLDGEHDKIVVNL